MQKAKSTKKNNKRIVLLTVISAMLTAVLVLSGVGIYLKVAHKEKNPIVEVNPLDFSIDTWDGSVEAINFNENYAGRGTKTKTINSAASFAHFIQEVNNGNDYADHTIYLNSSIDLNGQTIESIGTSEHPFKGTFDGGFYTIYNAKVNGKGLFGVTEGATIKNIGLYNANTNLIGKAINTNVENTFVRLGNSNLIAEYITNDGKYYVRRSFVDNSSQGIIEKLDTNSSSANGVVIADSYYTNGHSSVNEEIGEAYYADVRTIKATKLSDFAEWDYSAEYDADKKWTNYDYLQGSRKLSFNYPVQSGFVKTYLTGSCYESVMVTDNKIVDVQNLAEAFKEADKEDSAEINLLVEKIFMEAEAKVESAEVKVNAVKDTTIVRGENNTSSMFVGNGTSKIVLGEEQTTRATTPTLTLDGNRAEVEASGKESGALIVANGSDIEIHENVVIKNNVNNTVGYGGAVIIANAEDEVNISANFENCHSTNGGGAVAIVSQQENVKLNLGSFANCSSTGNGGAIYLASELPTEAVQEMATLYGTNKTIRAMDDEIGEVASGYDIADSRTYEGCKTREYGGVVYCEGELTISGSPIFRDNGGFSGDNKGGAVYAGSLTITGSPQFIENRGYVDGGAIYTTGDVTIIDNPSTTDVEMTIFDKNGAWGLAPCSYGGAIYAGGSVTIENARFIENYTYADLEQGYGGAIYSASSVSITGPAYFEGNYASIGSPIDPSEKKGGAIYATGVTISGDATFTDNGAYNGGAIYSTGDVTISAGASPIFTENRAAEQGGAIYSTGAVTISGAAKFEGNKADDSTNFSTSCSGGAIYAYNANGGNDATVTISADAEFKNNSAFGAGGYGGAIEATIVIISSGCSPIFEGNTTNCNGSRSAGGAISAGTITIDGTPTFKGNIAIEGNDCAGGNHGGAMYAETITINGQITLENNGDTEICCYGENDNLTLNSDITLKSTTSKAQIDLCGYYTHMKVSVKPSSDLIIYKYQFVPYDITAGPNGYIFEDTSISGFTGITDRSPFMVINNFNDSTAWALDYNNLLPKYGVVINTSYTRPIDYFNAPTEIRWIPNSATVFGFNLHSSETLNGGYDIQVTSSDENVVKIVESNIYMYYAVQSLVGIETKNAGEAIVTLSFKYGSDEILSTHNIKVYVEENPDELLISSINAQVDYSARGSQFVVHIPEKYSNGAIKLTSSNSDSVEVYVADNSVANGRMDVARFGHTFSLMGNKTLGRDGLVCLGKSNDATITIELYESTTSTTPVETKTFIIDRSYFGESNIPNTEYEVEVGGTFENIIDLNPDWASHQFTIFSSNSNVVKVTNPIFQDFGEPTISDCLEFVGAGTASIYVITTIYVEGSSRILEGFNVTVTAPSVAINLNKASETIQYGKQTTLEYSATTSGTFTISCDNPSVATLEYDTNATSHSTYVANIKAVGLGTANFTVSFVPSDGSAAPESKTFALTVEKATLEAPGNLNWTPNDDGSKSVASWDEVTCDGVDITYQVQLVLSGSVVATVTTTNNYYDFSEYLSANDGSYSFKVSALSANADLASGSSSSSDSTPIVSQKYTFVKGTGVKQILVNGVEASEYNNVEGEVLTITAVLEVGYAFDGWTFDGATAPFENAGAVSTIVSTGSGTITANAKIMPITVSIVSSNVGYGTISSTSGTLENNVLTLEARYGQNVSVNEDGVLTVGDMTVTATPATKTVEHLYLFDGWTGYSATLTSNTMIVANFSRTINRYTINISSSDTAKGTVNKDKVLADYGTSITFKNNELKIGDETVTATANDTTNQYIFGFDCWESSITSTVSGNVDIVAHFTATLNSHIVKFNVDPAGYGSVSIAPAVENNEIRVVYGTQITLNNNNTLTIGNYTISAVPAEDATGEFTYSFTNWSNHEGTVSEGRTITANFTNRTNEYTVNITVDPTGYGTVNNLPATSVTVLYNSTVSYSDANKEVLTIGDKVITARPVDLGDGYIYSFSSWSVVSGTKITTDTSIIARFDRTEDVYDITYDLVIPGAQVSGNPATYTINSDTITLSSPTHTNNAYTFIGWISDDIDEPTIGAQIIKGSMNDKHFTAVWTVDIDILANSNKNTYKVSVYQGTTKLDDYSNSFTLIYGQTYSFKVSTNLISDEDNNAYQIVRIKYNDVEKFSAYSPNETGINDSTILVNSSANITVTDKVTFEFEYLDAYMMKVFVPEDSIFGITVNTINNEENVIRYYSSANAYIISKGTPVTFNVNSVPASETVKHSYVGLTYVSNVGSATIGTSGGTAIQFLDFVYNTSYKANKDVGVYYYSVTRGVEIYELNVDTIITEVVEVVTSAIPAGVTITIESEHGLNKVIDATTTSVMLYEGEWKVTNVIGGSLTLSNLQAVFPVYEITETNGIFTIIVS